MLTFNLADGGKQTVFQNVSVPLQEAEVLKKKSLALVILLAALDL